MTCSSENLHSHVSDLKPLLAMSSLLLILLFSHHDLLSYPPHSCLLFSSVPSALTTSYSSGISSSVSSWLTYDSESRLSQPCCWKPRHKLLQFFPPSYKICLLPSPWFHRLAPLYTDLTSWPQPLLSSLRSCSTKHAFFFCIGSVSPVQWLQYLTFHPAFFPFTALCIYALTTSWIYSNPSTFFSKYLQVAPVFFLPLIWCPFLVSVLLTLYVIWHCRLAPLLTFPPITFTKLHIYCLFFPLWLLLWFFFFLFFSITKSVP